MKKNLILILISITILTVGIYLIAVPKVKYNKFDGGNYSFNLTTINGKISNANFKNKVVVLFFGYMNCPDICPTALADISSSFVNLTEDEKNNTQVIFISVDPTRDKISDLNEYVKYFSKRFIGASSDEKTLKELTSRFYAYYSYDEQKNSAVDYAVSHTSRIYLLDKNGNLKDTLESHKIQIKHISDAIKNLL